MIKIGYHFPLEVFSSVCVYDFTGYRCFLIIIVEISGLSDCISLPAPFHIYFHTFSLYNYHVPSIFWVTDTPAAGRAAWVGSDGAQTHNPRMTERDLGCKSPEPLGHPTALLSLFSSPLKPIYNCFVWIALHFIYVLSTLAIGNSWLFGFMSCFVSRVF